jgi:hypothetical protein
MCTSQKNRLNCECERQGWGRSRREVEKMDYELKKREGGFQKCSGTSHTFSIVLRVAINTLLHYRKAGYIRV